MFLRCNAARPVSLGLAKSGQPDAARIYGSGKPSLGFTTPSHLAAMVCRSQRQARRLRTRRRQRQRQRRPMARRRRPRRRPRACRPWRPERRRLLLRRQPSRPRPRAACAAAVGTKSCRPGASYEAESRCTRWRRQAGWQACCKKHCRQRLLSARFRRRHLHDRYLRMRWYD